MKANKSTNHQSHKKAQPPMVNESSMPFGKKQLVEMARGQFGEFDLAAQIPVVMQGAQAAYKKSIQLVKKYPVQTALVAGAVGFLAWKTFSRRTQNQ